MPSRITFSNNQFDCHIECGQCTQIKRDGNRCRNRVCYGFPLCWIHNQSEFGVRIRNSNIPNAQKGLFATKPFARGNWICPYNGEHIDANCINLRYAEEETAPYASEKDDGGFQDGACSRGIGNLANGIFNNDGTSKPINRHNSILVDREGELWLRATKRIQPNQEIYTFYGNEYILEDNYETKRRSVRDTRPC